MSVLVHTEDDRDVLAGRRDGGDHLLRAPVDVRRGAGGVGAGAGGLGGWSGVPTRVTDVPSSSTSPRRPDGSAAPGTTAGPRLELLLALVLPEWCRKVGEEPAALTRLAELAQHRP
ncbi:hypothetical protein ACFTY8_03515 [Streptomyces mirabilis]|uniref:hypothetical protein n=1 Tax=Streptomyces mirabilis TaxID=68239 RepID=UPI0036334C9F